MKNDYWCQITSIDIKETSLPIMSVIIQSLVSKVWYYNAFQCMTTWDSLSTASYSTSYSVFMSLLFFLLIYHILHPTLPPTHSPTFPPTLASRLFPALPPIILLCDLQLIMRLVVLSLGNVFRFTWCWAYFIWFFKAKTPPNETITFVSTVMASKYSNMTWCFTGLHATIWLHSTRKQGS